MKYNVVTSCTPQYLPGLIALKNSIDLNFPQAQLSCFWYSQGQDLELPEGINYIPEVPMKGHITDGGKQWRNGLKLGPDMYVRIHMPDYFDGRAFYVDVDCLVLRDFSSLWDLDLGDNITACVYRPDIGWKGGNIHDDMGSGTFMADCDAWNEQGMTDHIYQVMEDQRNGLTTRQFSLNVESALSYAHNGKFAHLPCEFQNLTYYNALTQNDIIAHFAGPKPWHIPGHTLKKDRVPYHDLWWAYHNNDLQTIKHLTQRLPFVRKPNAWPSRPKDLRR